GATGQVHNPRITSLGEGRAAGVRRKRHSCISSGVTDSSKHFSRAVVPGELDRVIACSTLVNQHPVGRGRKLAVKQKAWETRNSFGNRDGFAYEREALGIELLRQQTSFANE